MRHLVQLAPDRPEIPARLAALDGGAGAAPTGAPRSLLEGLRGVAVASLGLAIWVACSAAPRPAPAPAPAPAPEETSPFIVQGTDLDAAIDAVHEVGGEVTHQLAVIRAVGARLTASQRAELETVDGVTRVWEDRSVSLEAGRRPPPASSDGRPRPAASAGPLEAGG